MTIKELIQALQALPENTYVCAGECDNQVKLLDLYDIYVDMRPSPFLLVIPDYEHGTNNYLSLRDFINTRELIED